MPFANHAEFRDAMKHMDLAGCINPILGMTSSVLGTPKGFGSQMTKVGEDGNSRERQNARVAWVIRTFSHVHDRAALMVSHKTQWNIISVYGLFWEQAAMLGIIERFYDFNAYVCHPMLIPTLLIWSFVEGHQSEWYDMSLQVKQLETRDGVRKFSLQSNEDFVGNDRKLSGGQWI